MRKSAFHCRKTGFLIFWSDGSYPDGYNCPGAISGQRNGNESTIEKQKIRGALLQACEKKTEQAFGKWAQITTALRVYE